MDPEGAQLPSARNRLGARQNEPLSALQVQVIEVLSAAIEAFGGLNCPSGRRSLIEPATGQNTALRTALIATLDPDRRCDRQSIVTAHSHLRS